MSTKKISKKGIVAIVVVVILVLGSAIGLITTNKYENQTQYSTAEVNLTNKFILALMPKSIGPVTADGVPLTFYREANDDFDVTKNEPIEAFKYYYYDDNGEKIYLPSSGIYTPVSTDEDSILVSTGFFIKALENLKIVRSVLYVILGLVAVAVVCFLIYLWYKSWCKRNYNSDGTRKSSVARQSDDEEF